jgi:16S rRNA (cytidine1402-2'-O)-methyltransferase
MNNSGILYICPTPIGNLEDITLRAIRILKEVDLIACEDTRVTQKLLNHYDITTKSISYHKFSEKQKSEYLIKLLQEGKNIALVSDAGTPVLSDPGFELVKQAQENNIKVVPLPGASAIMTAFSASGLVDNRFTFVGFLPKSTKDREILINKYKESNIIFFESPSRFLKTLEELKTQLGNINLVVARELTKIYEEIRKDTIENHIDYFSKKQPKGEFTIIIEGKKENYSLDESILIEKIKNLKDAGYQTKEISKIISLLFSCPKGTVYDLAISQNK